MKEGLGAKIASILIIVLCLAYVVDDVFVHPPLSMVKLIILLTVMVVFGAYYFHLVRAKRRKEQSK